MKKFEAFGPMGNNSKGAWVEAEEAEALEQLNKEMLEVLKSTYEQVSSWQHESLRFHTTHDAVLEKLQYIIAKAEEV